MRSAERGEQMRLTWLSLFYETGYLLVAGVFLLTAPDTAFRLLFSNASYGDVLPRLFGTALFSTGAVLVQIVRLHIEELYTTTIFVRIPLIAVNLWLFYIFGQSAFPDAVCDRYLWRSADGNRVSARQEARSMTAGLSLTATPIHRITH
jgi:fatty acid desaturase